MMGMRNVRRLALCAALLWTGAAFAETADAPPTSPQAQAPLPLDAYGDLPGIEHVAISPSGQGLAILGRVNGQRQLVVLDGARKPLAIVPAGEAKIRDLNWVGEEAVLLTTSTTENLSVAFIADKAELFGALVVPLDGGKPWQVFEKSQNMARIIHGNHGLRFLGGKWQGIFSGFEFANSSTGNTVYGSNTALMLVDMKTNSTRRMAISSGGGFRRNWLIDAGGTIGARIDVSSNTGHWEISNQRGTVLASGTNPTGGIYMSCFGKDGASVIYSVEDESTGEYHMYEVPLAGGAPAEILPGINIDNLYIDQTSSRLLGYKETGRQLPVFFDPARQLTARKVMKAFPRLNVEINGWTPNFSHLLVRTSGNGDSGSWYLVDMTLLKAEPLGTERPRIVASQVGPISLFPYTAADGTQLDGVLTLPPGRTAKNLPMIMMPHGGPSAHDEVAFDWLAQAFASRGYAVFQPNFRGSTNRDAAFMRAGYGQWGRKMQTDLSDGIAELARQGIVDPKRACIVGASYGGYAALAGVTLQQGIYRCAVAGAPVSDLGELYNTRVRNSGDSKMTWKAMQESLGNPSTFGEVSPRRNAARADAPILLIHGKDDTVVPFSHSSAMAGALRGAGKPHELVILREEDHWLSRADTRKQMLEAAMRFVLQHNPAN